MTTKARHGSRAALFGAWLPLVLGLSGTAPGQAPPGLPGRAPPQVATSPPEASTLSVDFKGGTIAEYIDVLSKAAPDLNVVIRPETKEMSMPPVSLKGVVHGTALQLIPALADSGSEITVTPVRGGAGSEVFVIGVQPQRFQGAMPMGTSAPMMAPPPPSTVRGTGGMPRRSSQVQSGKLVRVFSLKALTAGTDALKPETVLTAIDTALGLQKEDGGAEAASLKLHAESGLLVVHGDPAQIDAVEQVLSTMEKDLRSQEGSLQQALQAENKQLKDTIGALERKLSKLEEQLSKTERNAAK